jgi:hypothetical protein
MSHSIYHFGSRAQALSVAALLPRVFAVGGKQCFAVSEQRLASGEAAKHKSFCYELVYTPREVPAKGQPAIAASLAHIYAGQMQGWVQGYLYAQAQAKKAAKHEINRQFGAEEDRVNARTRYTPGDSPGMPSIG